MKNHDRKRVPLIALAIAVTALVVLVAGSTALAGNKPVTVEAGGQENEPSVPRPGE